jgi:hypothetical protein
MACSRPVFRECYTFVRRRKYNIRKADKNPCITHNFIDAPLCRIGTASIPDVRLEDFYEAYAHDLKKGKALFISEIAAAEPFKLNYDFDLEFKRTEGFENPDVFTFINTLITNIQMILQAKVFSYGIDTRCIATSCGFTVKSDEVVKLGLHLYWPSVFVSHKQLYMIRRVIILAFEECSAVEYAGLQLHRTWRDIIDYNVVRRPQCRMFGSHKLEQCPCPNKPRKDECDIHEKALVDIGRAYRLISIHDGSTTLSADEISVLANDYFNIVKLTSLRLKPIPPPPAELNLKVADDYLENEFGPEKTPEVGDKSGKLQDETRESIKNSIRKYLYNYVPRYEPYVQKISVIKLMKKGKHDPFLIKFSSTYCINKGADHTSCTTYGILKPDVFTLFCRSVNDGVRILSKCPEFVVREYVPPAYAKLIFDKKNFVPPKDEEIDNRIVSRELNSRSKYITSAGGCIRERLPIDDLIERIDIRWIRTSKDGAREDDDVNI